LKNLFSIEGKVAVVTGGSRGIGEMIARGFVEAGARVYISSRKREACEEVAAALSKSGSAIAVPADVGTEAGVKQLAAEIAEREPALHVLVNNAGANWGAPYAEFPDSAWDKVLAVNLKGVFFLTRELTPLLEKGAKPGDPARVINIGSIDAIQVPPLETYAYSASKAAVHHLSRTLAVRLAPDNITVNLVLPGRIKTDRFVEHQTDRAKRAGITLEQQMALSSADIPMGRIGTPEEFAAMVVFLASARASYVTGTVVQVDGGLIRSVV